MKILTFGIVLMCSGPAVSAHPGHSDQPAERGTSSDPEVRIEVRDGYRWINSNGIPSHETGAFPNRRNPNTIGAQRHRFRVPENPVAADKPTPVEMSPFGVAINGVPFDPNAAEFWQNDRSSGWRYEAIGGVVDLGMDQHNAHVQPTGAYHYHGIPKGIIDAAEPDDTPVLVGWAADGFPIYGPMGYTDPADPESELKTLRASYRVREGERAGGPAGTFDGRFVEDWAYVEGAGDLDECNGRFGVTPEFPQGTYHYVLTAEFPFIPRMFKGTPDDSFIRRGPPGGRRPGRGPPDRGPRRPGGGRRGPPPR